MPKPKKNESKNDFLSRCTADLIKKESKSSKQAYAVCNKYWDEARGQRSALNLSSAPEFAEFKAGDQIREFLITAYTGSKLRSWFGDIVIDIAGIQTKEKMPILREHARDRVVGFGDAWREDNFYISGQFSNSTADAKEVLALADEGYPWQASISVRALKIESLKDDKTKAKVNGREVHGPLEIWRETKVGEVSFVSLGADDNTAAITMSDEKFDVEIISQSLKNNNNKHNIGGKKMEITLDLLKEHNPELLTEIQAEAEKKGIEKGVKEGSICFREDVEEQIAKAKETGVEEGLEQGAKRSLDIIGLCNLAGMLPIAAGLIESKDALENIRKKIQDAKAQAAEQEGNLSSTVGALPPGETNPLIADAESRAENAGKS